MNYTAELLDRLSMRRREELGTMSDQAFEELRLAVKQNPDAFVSNAKDAAFKHLGDALLADDASREDEEFMDDAAYEQAHQKRLTRLRAICHEALEIDAECLDAKLVLALTCSQEASTVLGALDELSQDCASHNITKHTPTTADEYAYRQAYLRLLAALVRSQLECASYSRCRANCETLLKLDPADSQGARYSLAIALARLEDEPAFNALDTRFARQGNAWSHIARTLLMFKFNRLSAARRALFGYAKLCRGGAYALLRPVFVETYLPDRPFFETGSFEEAVLAVHECDPVIMDTPDFLAWAMAQDGFSAQAEQFAKDNDLDW